MVGKLQGLTQFLGKNTLWESRRNPSARHTGELASRTQSSILKVSTELEKGEKVRL